MQHIQSPRTDDNAIEQEIKAKGLTAPRVTPDDLMSNIASTVYFTAFDGFQGSDANEDQSLATCDALRLLTFCVLVLRNGFTVTGESIALALRISMLKSGEKLLLRTPSKRYGRSWATH